MGDERKRILEMLSQGKLTAEEAEKLLDAISGEPAPSTEISAAPPENQPKTDPKYLRVLVESNGHHGRGKETVNVRVPFQLLRAGVRLAALIPGGLPLPAKQAMAQNGIDIEWDKIKKEDLEEVIHHLSNLQVDVDNEEEKVRIFCEW